MSAPFLVIQYPYDFIEIALCSNQNIIERKEIHKFEAIKLLIPVITQLLSQHNLTLSNLACISINRGPGPYNTLRSIISTINGFHFTQNIAFVELEALPLLLEDQPNGTIALLNAFSKRVYYGIKKESEIVEGICAVSDLPNIMQGTEKVIGNGIVSYEKELKEMFPQITIDKKASRFNSLENAIKKTYKKIQNKDIVSKYITPKYF